LLHVEDKLTQLGATGLALRPAKGKDGPVITENGNLILDVKFDEVPDDLEVKIKSITGVIESGLFMGFDVEVLMA
jgi:ribose 5-phosphate isomerase A